MFTESKFPTSTHLTHGKVFSLVANLLGASRPPDDAEPRPPGPWDPVFRGAFRDLLAQIAARQNPALYDVIFPHGPIVNDRLSRVGLNPQPLPPRSALLFTIAESVASRAELLQELAAATASDAEQRGIIIVSGYVGRFVREITQSGFRMPAAEALPAESGIFFYGPSKFPRPPINAADADWAQPELSGADLIVLGAAFSQAAGRAFDADVRRALEDAAARLAEAGEARLA